MRVRNARTNRVCLMNATSNSSSSRHFGLPSDAKVPLRWRLVALDCAFERDWSGRAAALFLRKRWVGRRACSFGVVRLVTASVATKNRDDLAAGGIRNSSPGGHLARAGSPTTAPESHARVRNGTRHRRMKNQAEGGGFEPPLSLRTGRFSRPVQSAALPSFQRVDTRLRLRVRFRQSWEIDCGLGEDFLGGIPRIEGLILAVGSITTPWETDNRRFSQNRNENRRRNAKLDSEFRCFQKVTPELII